MGPLVGDMDSTVNFRKLMNKSLNFWHDYCLDCLRHVVTVSKSHCVLFRTAVTLSIRLIP